MDDDTLRALLLATRRVALVGASDRPDRPSHGVMRFLLDQGFDVTPVNPTLPEAVIHGREVVGTLAEAVPLDLVDVFRRSREAAPVVEEALRLGARVVWLQLGVVVGERLASTARAAGMAVVMDRCPVIEWRRLGLPMAMGRGVGRS